MRSRLDGQAGSRRRNCRTPLGDRVSSKGHRKLAGRRQSSRRHYKMRLTLWACTLKSPPNFHGGALADATLRKSPALQVIKTQTQRFPAQRGASHVSVQLCAGHLYGRSAYLPAVPRRSSVWKGRALPSEAPWPSVVGTRPRHREHCHRE